MVTCKCSGYLFTIAYPIFIMSRKRRGRHGISITEIRLLIGRIKWPLLESEILTLPFEPILYRRRVSHPCIHRRILEKRELGGREPRKRRGPLGECQIGAIKSIDRARAVRQRFSLKLFSDFDASVSGLIRSLALSSILE